MSKVKVETSRRLNSSINIKTNSHILNKISKIIKSGTILKFRGVYDEYGQHLSPENCLF